MSKNTIQNTADSARSIRSGRSLTVRFFLGVFLMSLAWVLATPLGAGPDEPAHVIKAASVVRGEFVGDATDEPAVRAVQVPAAIAAAHSWPCFAFDPNESAGCLWNLDGETGLKAAETTAGIYNPVYYLLTGWPSLMTESAYVAVIGMRILTALGASFFLAVTFGLLRRLTTTKVATIGAVALATPTVFFLNAVVNPNAWEITAGVAFLASLLCLSRLPEFTWQGMRYPLFTMLVSGVVAANTRGISPFWLVVMVAIVLVATPLSRTLALIRSGRFWLFAAPMVIGIGFGAAWTLFTGTLGSMGTFPGANDTSPFQAFNKMIWQTISDPGLVGVFGWLDTFAPGIVYVLYGGAALLILAVAVLVSTRRARLTVLFSVVLVILAPAILQALSVKNSGYIWQGRYTLVIYAAAILVAVLITYESLRERPSLVSIEPGLLARGQRLFVVALGIGYLSTFIAVLHRYMVGELGGYGTMFRSPDWAPPGTALGVIALSVVGVALMLLPVLRVSKQIAASPAVV